MQGRKFISPQSWFSLIYPASWNEFEDREGSFLFYNPNRWTGNFRISVYRKELNSKGAMMYAEEEMKQVLTLNNASRKMKIGSYNAVYYLESAKEEGVYYTTHHWILGEKNTVIECSFTVPQGVGYDEVIELLNSIEIRSENKKYPSELIPIRLAETYEVNVVYDEISHRIKTSLSKEFQGTEEDLNKLQEVINKGLIGGKKRKDWFGLGVVLCVMLYNEVEGFEWKTLVDGSREAPVLYYVPSKRVIDPLAIVWNAMEKNGVVNVIEIYKELLSSL